MVKNKNLYRLSAENILLWLGSACFLTALFIAVTYAHQPLLDLYSFRQTQTALTAYWFMKDGFSLAYQTPVAGLPWSIPFEFPIYQILVALIGKISGVSLDAIGRLASFAFLALCLWPARSISKNLKLPESTLYIFTALLFSSPIYLYWGRTFMIETAAVFFCFAAIKYFLDIIQNRNMSQSECLFAFFMSLAILQKATTGLPVLAVLGCIYLILHMRAYPSLQTALFNAKFWRAAWYLGLPLVVGVIWTVYTDHIKNMNGLGVNLTSHALHTWNWGSLAQRRSSELYVGVIWKRVVEKNLGGCLGLVLFILPFYARDRSVKAVMATALTMGFLPFFLFTNLHIVHTYYQSANVIFLIFALAVSLAWIMTRYAEGKLVVPVVILMLISNYLAFADDYWPSVKAVYTTDNSRDYAVGAALKKSLPADKSFVAFGNDWNSSFAYLAQRKSFTVPTFFKDYDRVAHHPEQFIPENQLGAVVLCPPLASPTVQDLFYWASTGRNWKIGMVSGCYLAVPATAPLDRPVSRKDIDAKS